MRVRIVCAAVLAASTAVFFAPHASAGPCEPGPGGADGRLKRVDGAPQFSGNNEYSSIGAEQTLSKFNNEGDVTPGVFKIRYENESKRTKDIRLDGTVLNTGDAESYTIQLVRGNNDVTTKVLEEKLLFRNVPPGALTKVLTLTFTPKPIAEAPDDVAVRVAGRYASKPLCKADVVGTDMEILEP